MKPNSDCNYTFPFDLAPNGIPFDAKSIIRVQTITIQIWLHLQQNAENICVRLDANIYIYIGHKYIYIFGL